MPKAPGYKRGWNDHEESDDEPARNAEKEE
jgi:hypothetical protein